MAGAQVHIVRTGIANIASVAAAIRRGGGEPVMTADAAEIDRAAALVLPGVGSFPAGMAAIRECGLAEALRRRIESQRPTMCICLGMQVLFESSEEGSDVEGLGVVPGIIGKFRGEVRVPQLGWNAVEPDAGCAILQPGFAYFANSYRADAAPAAWSCAWSDHGGRFIAAMERGPVLACQFHPELSGRWGEQLISRWLTLAGVRVSSMAEKGGAIRC